MADDTTNTTAPEGDTLTQPATTVTITFMGEKGSRATDAVQIDGKVYALGVPVEVTSDEAEALRKRDKRFSWTVKQNTPVEEATAPLEPGDPIGEPAARADGPSGTVEVVGGTPTVVRDTIPATADTTPRRTRQTS